MKLTTNSLIGQISEQLGITGGSSAHKRKRHDGGTTSRKQVPEFLMWILLVWWNIQRRKLERLRHKVSRQGSSRRLTPKILNTGSGNDDDGPPTEPSYVLPESSKKAPKLKKITPVVGVKNELEDPENAEIERLEKLLGVNKAGELYISVCISHALAVIIDRYF